MNVALLITCLTDTFLPRVGEAVVRVLRHFGCRVEFPPQQTCCGQPAYNSGFHADALAVARRTIRVFEPFERVVCPSASCTAMIRSHYPELFGPGDRDRGAALRLASRVTEFACFLRDVLHVDIGSIAKFAEPAVFHYPCHARGVISPAELAAACGPHVAAPPRVDLCCGFGGAFAVDYPSISGGMLEDRLNDLATRDARLVVCNEAGCTMQLAGGARRRGLPLRFKHLAECMAESLGLMEPDA